MKQPLHNRRDAVNLPLVELFQHIPDLVSSINKTAFNNCCSSLVLSVASGSYAEQWAIDNGIAYESRAVKETPIESGSCGDSAIWELYSDGTLKILGSGAMTNFTSATAVPWYDYRKSITSIEIGKDITSIGVYAFRGAVNCTSVTFEEGSQVASIGGNAFYYMSKLEEITLPDSVTSIGNYAFGYDAKLSKVYIPDLVSSINKTAFNNCCSSLVLSVASGSYAEQWAIDNGVAYTVRDSAGPANVEESAAVQDVISGTETPSEVMPAESANAVCEVGTESITQAMGFQQVNLYEYGTIDTKPSNQTRKLTYALVGAVAAMLTYTAFLIFYLVDDTLRTDEDIQQYLGLTILGDIPNANNANKKHYGYYSAYGGKRAKQAKKGG